MLKMLKTNFLAKNNCWKLCWRC